MAMESVSQNLSSQPKRMKQPYFRLTAQVLMQVRSPEKEKECNKTR
jgi:hypothetical protein